MIAGLWWSFGGGAILGGAINVKVTICRYAHLLKCSGIKVLRAFGTARVYRKIAEFTKACRSLNK